MPKNNDKKRQELWFDEPVLDGVKKLASKKGWAPKKYMEQLISKHVGRYYIIDKK